MTVEQLNVIITAQNTEFKRRLDEVNGRLDDMADTAQKSADKTYSVFQGLGNKIAALGIGKIIGDSIMNAGELEQNLGGSEAVFKAYAESIQSSAASAYKDMGLSEARYLATANKMGALFKGSGMDIERSAQMTQVAMQRAADVASIMGIDTASAMEAVTGAAKGNFTMMDNLGVAINDTTLQIYAQEKGLGKLETTQDKVNAAMQMFLEKTEYAAGNYAKENETFSGSLSTLQAEFENLTAEIGTELLPAATSVLSVMSTGFEIAAPIITDVAGGVNDVAQAVINASPQTKQLLTLTVAAAVAIPAVTKATALLTAAKAGYNTILTLLIPKQLTFGAALKATAGWIGVIGGALAIFSLLNDKTEHTKAVNDNAASSFKAEKKGADEAADGVDNLAESMDGLDKAVKGSLASVDKLNILRSSSTGSFTSGLVSQNDLDLLENAIGLTGDLKNELDELQNVKSIDWFSFLNEDELYNSLKRLNDLSRKLFGDEWTNHWNAVGKTIYEAFSHPDPVVRDNALQEIYGWLESLNNPIQEFFGDFGALWSETWQKVAIDFTTALEKAGSIFQLWDSEFRRIASEMYEIFSGGKIDEIELHSKYSDLVQQIQLATNEYIRQGISAEKALAMAERDFLNSSEAVYYYENLAQNRRTLEEVQAAEQTIRMQGYDYTDMKTLDEFINASVVSADFANTRPDWVVYPQYVPTTGPQQELPPINIFMDGEEISYHVTSGQTREQTRSNGY